jgi:polysaccharide deacetylase family protein (PEP-CTERM system associated)
MKNIFTVDVEDWFCAYNLHINIKEWDKQELRVVENTRKILRLLSKHEIKATFFALGWIAEKVPELFKEIELDGHEIATHGYSHTLISKMSPEDFKKDMEKALKVMGPILSRPIIGFRAPSFSITNQNIDWALQILKEYGIKYDSSVFPIGFHPDYGIPDSDLNIHQRNGITEVPLSVAEVLGKKIPCSGGAYFRFFPYYVFKNLIEICNKQRRPVVFYIHPWELDPDQPKQQLSFSKNLRHYTNLESTEEKLETLLSQFEFQTIKEALNL